MPKIKIHFFKPSLPDNAEQTLDQMIRSISELEDEDKTKSIGSMPYRLQEFEVKKGLVIGDMAKIRMNQLPEKMKLNGESSSLDLDDDEGIGEKSAFLYDPHLNILVYQSNRTGVGTGAFGAYIALFNDAASTLVFDPICTKDSYERLKAIPYFKRLEIQIASPKDYHPEGNIEDDSMMHFLSLKDELDAPNITLYASMGRASGFLDNATRRLINSARKLVDHGYDVKTIRVGGIDENGEPQEVELIEERLIEVDNIEVNSRREASYENRVEALLAAYKKHVAYLKTF